MKILLAKIGVGVKKVEQPNLCDNQTINTVWGIVGRESSDPEPNNRPSNLTHAVPKF